MPEDLNLKRDKLFRHVMVRVHHGEGRSMVSHIDMRGGEFTECKLESLPADKAAGIPRGIRLTIHGQQCLETFVEEVSKNKSLVDDLRGEPEPETGLLEPDTIRTDVTVATNEEGTTDGEAITAEDRSGDSEA